jgi:hypothetical protein
MKGIEGVQNQNLSPCMRRWDWPWKGEIKEQGASLARRPWNVW